MQGYRDTFGAQYATGFAEQQATELLSLLLTPGKIAAQYSLNRLTPMVYPPVGTLIEANIRGFVGNQDAIQALGALGVNVGQREDKAEALTDHAQRGRCWQGVAKMMMHRPGPDHYLRAVYAGLITEDDMRGAAAMLGLAPETWEPIRPLFRAYPSPGELAVARNRKFIDEDRWKEIMRLGGGWREDCLKIHDELRFQIASPADLIHMEAKEAFTVDVASALHLYDEFPGNAMRWFEWHGLARPLDMDVTADGQQVKATWPLLYWAAHWTPIAPGQVYTMLQRLRPDRVAKYAGMGLNIQPFTLQDADRWLRYQNFPPGIRDNLKAISYRPISIRYAKALYLADVHSRQEAIANMQDNGYDAQDSADIVLTWELEAKDKADHDAERQRERCHKALMAEVYARVQLGTLSPEDASARLEADGVDPGDISDCLVTARAKLDTALTRSTVSRIRSEYLSGGLTAEECSAELAKAGIVPSASDSYVGAWTQQLTLKRREMSLAKVVRWYTIGLIGRENAAARLQRLGFGDTDTALSLAEADQVVGKMQAKEYEALQRKGRAQAKALERVQREAAAQYSRTQAALRKATPVSRIRKMLKEHVVSEQWAERRLMAIGESLESIALYFREWGYEDRASDIAERAKELRQRQADERLVPLSDLKSLAKRGKLTPAEFALNLSERGMTNEQIQLEMEAVYDHSIAPSSAMPSSG